MTAPAPPGSTPPSSARRRRSTRRCGCACSPRRPPDGRSSRPSRSTRCCSCATTGSSSGRTSTRSSRRSQTRPCARSAATCRRRRSSRRQRSNLRTPKTSDAEVAVALFGSVLLLVSLAVYGQWVLVGVVEEKSNRVVELILSTVRPRHLLAGKVIGIGLLGLAQLALVAGLAATLLAAGAFDAPAALGGSVALVVPWFALGFALYAVAFAAAGALASRQQDASTAGQPVTLTLVAAYFAGYVALVSRPDGTVAQRAHRLPARPRHSSCPPEARSSACRSGSTRSRSCSPSARSTRSSDSPAASTPTASSTPAPASALAQPGASPTVPDERRHHVLRRANKRFAVRKVPAGRWRSLTKPSAAHFRNGAR